MTPLHRRPGRPARSSSCFLISVVAFLLVHLLPGDPTLAILGPNDTARGPGRAAAPARAQQAPARRSTGPGSPTSSTATWAISFLTHQTVTNAIGRGRPHRPRARSSSPRSSPSSSPSPWPSWPPCAPTGPSTASPPRRPSACWPLPTFVAGPLLVLVFAVTDPRLPGHRLQPPVPGPRAQPQVGHPALDRPRHRVDRHLLPAAAGRPHRHPAGGLRHHGPGQGPVDALHPAAPRPAAVVVLPAGRRRASASAPCSPGPSWWRSSSSCPGIGFQLVQAINSRDYLVVQGMALVAAVAYVVDQLRRRLPPHLPRPAGAPCLTTSPRPTAVPVASWHADAGVEGLALEAGLAADPAPAAPPGAGAGRRLLDLLGLGGAHDPAGRLRLGAAAQDPQLPGLLGRQRRARASTTSSAPTTSAATCCRGSSRVARVARHRLRLRRHRPRRRRARSGCWPATAAAGIDTILNAGPSSSWPSPPCSPSS